MSMLFKVSGDGHYERFSTEELTSYKNQLVEMLPHVFGSGSTQPMRLLFTGSKTVDVYKAGGVGGRQRRKSLHPGAVSISTMGFYNDENGIRQQVRLSSGFPVKGAGGSQEWPKTVFNIAHNKTFDAVRDLEEIIFLMFFSGNIQNGKVGAVSAQFKIDMPINDARDREVKIHREYAVDRELMITETRMSYEDVKKIAALFPVPIVNIEGKDRIILRDAALMNPANTARYHKVRDQVLAAGKSKTANVADLSAINETVKEAIKMGVLVEDGGMWVVKNDLGVTVRSIVAMSGGTKKDRQINLVEYLGTDAESVEVLQGFTMKTV